MAERLWRFLFLLVPMGWGVWASYQKDGWSEAILLGAFAGLLILVLFGLVLLGLLGLVVMCMNLLRHR